ncbi:MAG: Ig-like domain-containing protein [Clostridium sp.]
MKESRYRVSLIFILQLMFLLSFSAYLPVSAAELNDIKIEYKGEVFTGDTPQSEVENRFFFNELTDTTLNISIDLSTLYKERQPSNQDAPVDVVSTLNDSETPLNATISPILSGGSFVGKYNLAISVPAGNDKDLVNIKIKSKSDTEWNIINSFNIVFNVYRDSSAPNIIVEGVNEFGVATDTVSISLYEDYKQTSTMTVNLVNPNNEPLSINGEYKGTSVIKVNQTIDGQYKGTVTAIDKAGNSSKKDIVFSVNNTPPTIKFDGEEKTKEYYANNYIKVEISDLFAIDLTKSNYKLITPSAKEISGVFDLSSSNQGLAVVNFEEQGKYTLEVNAFDSLGQSSKSTQSFIVDKTMPMVDITNVDGLMNSIITGIDKVEVKVHEENFDVNNVKFIIKKQVSGSEMQNIEINGKDVPNSSNGNAHVFNLSSVFLEDKENGIFDVNYDITVNAIDKAGNETNPKSTNNVKFTIDNNAPKLSVPGVENNHHYNSEYIDLAGIITDLNLETSEFVIKKTTNTIGAKPEVITIDKNDIKVEVNGTTTTYSIRLSDEAMYDVTLSAKDKAGNSEKLSVKFTIDRTKPLVTINNYNEINGTFSLVPKTVSISVTDINWRESTVNVVMVKQKLNGTNETIVLPAVMNKETTTFTYDNFTDDATYIINVSANDSAGNASEVNSVTFTTDKTAPKIFLSGVENDKFYNTDRPVIVKILDINHSSNTIYVLKDGAPYPVTGFYGDGIEKVFNYTFTKEGRYEIDVASTDKAGNETKHPKVVFNIDKTAPGVKAYFKGENRAISDGEYINKIFTPEFRLDNSEDIIESISLNGEGNYSQGVPMASKEMMYDYNVVVRDKANNKTAYNIKFTVDTTVPEVKIEGLLSGFFNKDLKPTFEISDTHLVSDKSGATLNGEPYVSGTAITEQKEYTLQIKGVDLANNETVKSIGFTLDKDKPVIRFVEPISGKYFTEDFIPKFVIDDLSNYTIIAMTLDGKDYQMGEIITEEGKHVLYIEVKDKAGNAESISVEFILDKTPPKFLIKGVENNGRYNESITSIIKLENPLDTINSIEVDGQPANGEIKNEGDQQIAKLRFSDLKKYKIKLNASDVAGNSTEEIIEFEIVDNNVISQITNNKSIMVPVVVAILATVPIVIFMIYRNKKNKDENK